MSPSALSILARFDGNAHEAIAYCVRITILYPQFAQEYDQYISELKGNLYVNV